MGKIPRGKNPTLGTLLSVGKIPRSGLFYHLQDYFHRGTYIKIRFPQLWRHIKSRQIRGKFPTWEKKTIPTLVDDVCPLLRMVLLVRLSSAPLPQGGGGYPVDTLFM